MLGKNLCRRCNHSFEAHQHYRKGTDCSAAGCTCPKFRRWRKR